MEDLKNWALTIVTGAMGTIITLIVSFTARQALRRLDELVKDIRHISSILTTQEQRIINLQESHNTTERRMNDHATRLRAAEQDIAVLKRNP